MSNRSEISETPDYVSILAHTRTLEGRVDGIERAVDALGRRLDSGLGDIGKLAGDIGKQVSDLGASLKVQQALPQFSLQAVLAVVCMCATLLGVGATSIIFISTAISAGPQATLQAEARADRNRLDRVERLIERALERQTVGLNR